MDSYFDLPDGNGLENGSIVLYIENPNQEQVNGDAHIPKQRPKKPRALAYQFFEWEEDSSRYKCKICGYVRFVLCAIKVVEAYVSYDLQKEVRSSEVWRYRFFKQSHD